MSTAIIRTPYGAIRPQLRTGDAVWTTDASWLSKAIRFATRGIVSHMAMVYRTDQFVTILESVGMGEFDGVGISRLSSKIDYVKARKGGRIFVGTLRPDIRRGLDKAGMVDTMRSLRGLPYDYWQAFWSWLKLPFRRQAPKRMFCAEAVAYTYSRHGVLPKSYPYSKATPQNGWDWPVYGFTTEVSGW